MDSVITIPALGDNFIYLCRYEQDRAFAVDTCDVSAVLRVLKKQGLKLTAILVTHHHFDHTAGIKDLKKETGCQIIGGDKRRIPGIDNVFEDGLILTLGNTKIQVITTPGHTNTSVCFYRHPVSSNQPGILFTGDTLFVNGCGRLFECDARTMLNSLLKLVSLPDDTLIYPGHDYTVENYEFALTIEPDNEAIKTRLQQLRQIVDQGGQTVPSTILQEKITNPFLRADTSEIKASLNMSGGKTEDVFAELRRRKDIF